MPRVARGPLDARVLPETYICVAHQAPPKPHNLSRLNDLVATTCMKLPVHGGDGNLWRSHSNQLIKRLTSSFELREVRTGRTKTLIVDLGKEGSSAVLLWEMSTSVA